jgi:hypothetical protein
MRDYSVIVPSFWIGETGKKLRGDVNAQVLALYLMTCPHSTMTGVFHCPILYMAHETGLTMEGATKALARLSEEGFCEYDEVSECVFVVRMAAYQIAESLKPGDKRILGVKKYNENMVPACLKARFIAIYSVAFSIETKEEKSSPFKAPSKPLPSQEQEQEQEQEKKIKEKTAVSMPDGISITVWQDFKTLRNKLKAPITETALDGIRREADKAGVDLNEALRISCERSWRGFRAEWMDGGKSEARAANHFAGAI